MNYVFVVGPWGAGTSAVAGVLEALGCDGLAPYWRVPDPRTPSTFESTRYRALVTRLVSVKTLEALVSDAHIQAALGMFRRMIEAERPCSVPRFLKHPLSAMLLRPIAAVYTPRFVFVTRPADQIERTRLRRGWDERYGPAAIARLQSRIDAFVAESSSPVLTIDYSRLLANPGETVKIVAEFLGNEAPDAVDRARASIRQSGG